MPGSSRKRILLIDDEDDIREVARVSLELVGGWEVLLARSAREGLAKAAAELPDAILLDVMMPDMDGPTAFQELQATPAIRHIPGILLTAKVQSTDQRQFAGMDVTGVIAKPFDPLTLPRQVATALDWSQ